LTLSCQGSESLLAFRSAIFLKKTYPLFLEKWCSVCFEVPKKDSNVIKGNSSLITSQIINIIINLITKIIEIRL
jgi:hypothetical protein